MNRTRTGSLAGIVLFLVGLASCPNSFNRLGPSSCLGSETNEADSPQSIKVALVAGKAHELHKSPLVSLLEVELSQTEGIKLLERTEIARMLAEQQLGFAGLSNRRSAIKVGRLLRADTFLLLSAEDGRGNEKDKAGLLRV
ncbi:MAG: hypothetical protein ACYSWQ_21660, partial [Planctomycetota bacterium]